MTSRAATGVGEVLSRARVVERARRGLGRPRREARAAGTLRCVVGELLAAPRNHSHPRAKARLRRAPVQMCKNAPGMYVAGVGRPASRWIFVSRRSTACPRAAPCARGCARPSALTRRLSTRSPSRTTASTAFFSLADPGRSQASSARTSSRRRDGSRERAARSSSAPRRASAVRAKNLGYG
eukprot:1437058-Prymnesium_polylepis.1